MQLKLRGFVTSIPVNQLPTYFWEHTSHCKLCKMKTDFREKSRRPRRCMNTAFQGGSPAPSWAFKAKGLCPAPWGRTATQHWAAQNLGEKAASRADMPRARTRPSHCQALAKLKLNWTEDDSLPSPFSNIAKWWLSSGLENNGTGKCLNQRLPNCSSDDFRKIKTIV